MDVATNDATVKQKNLYFIIVIYFRSFVHFLLGVWARDYTSLWWAKDGPEVTISPTSEWLAGPSTWRIALRLQVPSDHPCCM